MDITQYYQGQDERISNWLKTHAEPFLLDKNDEYRDSLDHILDFLNSKDSPKKITRLGYLDAVELSNKWMTNLIKKADDIEESDAVDLILNMEQYSWVKLKSESSYKREGKLMGHCVSSYYDKKEVSIFSLRDNKNEPHCTIEIDVKNNYIKQVKGKNNKAVINKYHKPIIEFLDKTNYKINDYELKNFGAVKIKDGFVHVDCIPEGSVFGNELKLYQFTKLPRDLILGYNSSVNLIGADKSFFYDLSNWQNLKKLEISNASIKQQLLSCSSFTLLNGQLDVNTINIPILKLRNSIIKTDTIISESLSLNESEITFNTLKLNDSLICENCNIVLNNSLDLRSLSLHDSKVKINFPINVEHLDLSNCVIDQESINNINVSGSVNIKCSQPIEIPAWYINRYIDLKSANVVMFKKGFKANVFFAQGNITQVLDSCNISYKTGSKDLDIKESYFLMDNDVLKNK